MSHAHGDIPELFRQFSGDATDYHEVRREDNARASLARWPLLTALTEATKAADAAMPAQTPPAVAEREVDRHALATARGMVFIEPAHRNAQHLAIEARHRAARETDAATLTIDAVAADALHDAAPAPRDVAPGLPAAPSAAGPAHAGPVHPARPALQALAPRIPPAVIADSPRAAAPTRHAGLQPLFARLAGVPDPAPAPAPAPSLFQRLLQS